MVGTGPLVRMALLVALQPLGAVQPLVAVRPSLLLYVYVPSRTLPVRECILRTSVRTQVVYSSTLEVGDLCLRYPFLLARFILRCVYTRKKPEGFEFRQQNTCEGYLKPVENQSVEAAPSIPHPDQISASVSGFGYNIW